jgi:adenylate kinase
MKLVVLGSPGAGKGTYTQELERRTGIKHISTGDLLREYITKDNSLAIKVKKFMTDGKLVPDELVIEIIISMLKEKNL